MSASAERRERYAAALYEDANPGFRWVDIPDNAPDTAYWLDKAVAVMAVADAEIADAVSPWKGAAERGTSERAELTKRLGEARDEIDRLSRELERARRDADYHNRRADGILAAAVEAQDRLDASRSKLDSAKRTADTLRAWVKELDSEKGELRDDLAYAERRCKSATEGMRERDALIQRVREVLNNAGLDDIETGFFQDVRDALEGEG